MSDIKHYGWQVSPYSAKTRAYLTYKRIPFEDHVPSIRMLTGKIARDVGQMIMPVVYVEGQAISDSTRIIEHFEQTHPNKPILPADHKQRFAALFIELFADEWLPLAALHYRWNYAENRAFILKEFGRSALPWFPSFIQTFAAKRIAAKMSGYLPVLGMTTKMHQPLEANTEHLMSILDKHFSSQPFVFGPHPTLADFALFGPLWAHLDRDPHPKDLVAKHPNLKHWIERMKGDFKDVPADSETDETIAGLPNPLLGLIGETILPLVQQSKEAIEQWCLEHPAAKKLPRKIGQARLQIGDQSETRLNLTYPYWMFQRIHQAYSQLSTSEQTALLYWFDAFSPNYRDLLQSELPANVSLHQSRLWLKRSKSDQASNEAA